MIHFQATHKKIAYNAECIQWTGNNTSDVISFAKNVGASVSIHSDKHLIVRAKGGFIEAMGHGWWLRIGENFTLKIMSDETFVSRYEETK